MTESMQLDDHEMDAPEAKSNRKPGPRHRRGRGWRVPTLALILIAGAALRLMLWFWFQGLPIRISDENDYDTLATNLVEYGEFAYEPGEPFSLRPPLYPFVVSGLYKLFGVHNYQAVRLIQAGVSLLNALLLYGIGTRLYDRRTGLWLTALYMFYPPLLGMNNLLLTEVQFTFLLTASIFVLMHAVHSRTTWLLIPVGMLLGLGALTRSVLWLFLPVISLEVFLAWPTSEPRWSKWDLARRLIASGALFLAGVLTIAPWAIRNTRLEKTFIAVDSMGGRNVMMGNYEYTPLHRSWDAISIEGEKSWYAMLAKRTPASATATQGQKDKMALKYGIHYAATHPLQTLQRDLVKFFDFWGLERVFIAGMKKDYFGPIPRLAQLFLTLIILGACALAMFTGLFGAVMTPPSDRRIFGLFLLVIGFVCGMHTLSFGHSRYQLPVMPLVLVFSAAAIRHRGKIWEARGGKRFFLAAALCVVLLLAWTWDVVFMESDKFFQALGA